MPFRSAATTVSGRRIGPAHSTQIAARRGNGRTKGPGAPEEGDMKRRQFITALGGAAECDRRDRRGDLQHQYQLPACQIILDVTGDLFTHGRQLKQLVFNDRIIGLLGKLQILGRFRDGDRTVETARVR